MSINKRLLGFLAENNTNKFKTVLKEELTNRTVESIYNKTLLERKSVLTNSIPVKQHDEQIEPANETTVKFVPEHTYRLKDGNTGILTTEEQTNISKLYENLNTDNRERMVKLLKESQESFNRIVRLAKIESKKDKQ